MAIEQLGALQYTISLLNSTAKLSVCPHLKLDASNRDSNWNEPFTKAEFLLLIEGRQIFHLSRSFKNSI